MFLLKNEEYITKMIDLRLYTFFVTQIGAALWSTWGWGETYLFFDKKW